MIKHTVDCFRQLGTYDGSNHTRKQLARKHTTATVDNICTRTTANHGLSTCRLVVQVSVSRTSIWRTLKQLALQPYKILVLHEFEPPSYDKQAHYCRWFLHFIRDHGMSFCDHGFIYPAM